MLMHSAVTGIAMSAHRLYALMDSGQYEQAAAMFEKHGELLFGPGSAKPGLLRREQIRAAFLARSAPGYPQQRHVSSNMIVTPCSDGEWEAHSLLTIYRFGSSPYPVLLAEVQQRWRQVDSEWKVRKMEVIPVECAGVAADSTLGST